MILKRPVRIAVTLGLCLGVAAGCGKKKKHDNDDDEEEVTPPAGNGGGGGGDDGGGGSSDLGKLTVGGRLGSGFGLTAAAPTKVLAFKIVKGVPTGLADVLSADIAADGSFSLDLPKSDEQTSRINSCMNADGTWDAAKLGDALGQDLSGADQDALASAARGALDAAEAGGGTSYVLVSMVASGDKVAEAQTFTFIGLPSGSDTLIDLPVNRAEEPALDLGAVSASGDEAQGEVAVKDAPFTLTTETMEQLAATNDALKGLKNLYMNSATDSSAAMLPSPSFAWKGLASAVKNTYSAPTAVNYSGYLVEIRITDHPEMTLAAMCDAAGTGHKAVQLVPPAEIVSGTYPSGSDGLHFSPASPLSNQYADVVQTDRCGHVLAQQGIGGEFGVSSSSAGNFYLGFGGGSGFKGAIPTGIWQLKYDGAVAGNFDYTAGYPLDGSGNPTVYIPTVKATVNGSNEVTAIDVKFHVYKHTEGGAGYEEVSDLTAFDRVVSAVNVSVTDYSGVTGNTDRIDDRFDLQYSTVKLTRTGNTYTADVAHGEHAPWRFADDASSTVPVAGAIRISYQMYGSQYAFEFRP